MLEYLHSFSFGVYPYICLMVFTVGNAVRFHHNPYSLTCHSSQFLSGKNPLRIGILLFHGGVLWIVVGHLFGLLTPYFLYKSLISASNKQFLAMTTGGIAGILCFIGVTLLFYRRLTNPHVKTTSNRGDFLILMTLWLQLVLGIWIIFVSMDHLDGALMMQLAQWAQHIATARPDAAEFLRNVHWVFQAHIFLGLTMFLLFPFSKLVHIWSGFASLLYLVRPYQNLRSKKLQPNNTVG